jgi:DNA invertase Pin-like site-specific DNA recombinase
MREGDILFFHVTAAFDEFQRELIVENTSAGLAAAHKRGCTGGRPPSMTMDKIRTAESMLKDSENYPFISDIIKQSEVGRTTFYRDFPPERISELRQLK